MRPHDRHARRARNQVQLPARHLLPARLQRGHLRRSVTIQRRPQRYPACSSRLADSRRLPLTPPSRRKPCAPAAAVTASVLRGRRPGRRPWPGRCRAVSGGVARRNLGRQPQARDDDQRRDEPGHDLGSGPRITWSPGCGRPLRPPTQPPAAQAAEGARRCLSKRAPVSSQPRRHSWISWSHNRSMGA